MKPLKYGASVVNHLWKCFDKVYSTTMKLILRLGTLVIIMLDLVFVWFYADTQAWHFLHELFLIGLPTLWLLLETMLSKMNNFLCVLAVQGLPTYNLNMLA